MKKHVLITAGPTREWMDPVRFLSNASSGAMGLAIARALRSQARVTIVLGPTSLAPPPNTSVVRVESARDMWRAVKSRISNTDVFISTAAVGDWRFAAVRRSKLKKGRGSFLSVRLVKNPDIARWVGTVKKRRDDLVTVGFALETDRLRFNAEKKMKEKNFDLLVANDPRSFAGGTIHARWLEKGRSLRDLGRIPKQALAKKLVGWLKRKCKTKHAN